MPEPIINLQPTVLEDDLVRIIPLGESDFNKLYAVASDPLIWEQHPTSDRYKKEVFKIYFDSAVKSGSAFLLYEEVTNELMGSTRYYDYNPEQSKIAIGFTFLARKFWGGDYNRSVKKLMLDYAFRFVDSVIFHIGPSNIRSQKAILKIGAKKTGEVLYDGKPHFEYEIRRLDWVSKTIES